MFFVWPHSIGYLEESGIMDRIRQRIYPSDEAGRVEEQVARAMQKLFLLEQRAARDAILGRNYHTLWEKTPA